MRTIEAPLRIALTFLTCDRVDYTRRTLTTLAAHNDLSQFVLLHGDDASTDDAGGELARSMGFSTTVQTNRRVGVAKMTADLFDAADSFDCDFVLNLQNDWESARPIPVVDFERIFSDRNVYCLRLYGAMKSATGRCGIHHGGREPRRVVDWKPHAIDGYELGDIHWGHPPAVTRIRHALKLTRGAPAESESRRRSGRVTDLTARVVANVFNHIGAERTTGFRA